MPLACERAVSDIDAQHYTDDEHYNVQLAGDRAIWYGPFVQSIK